MILSHANLAHYYENTLYCNILLSVQTEKLSNKEMDGWMICDFLSFSTVFQSYQDDERLIMKGCVQWSSVYG